MLSTGIAPAPDNRALSSMLRTSLTADGFFLEAHPKLRPVDLASEGVFVCGLAHSPRFMDETIAQAQAAAARAATVLSKPYLEIGGQVAQVDADECTACMTCVKVCPYGAPVLNERAQGGDPGGEVHGLRELRRRLPGQGDTAPAPGGPAARGDAGRTACRPGVTT